MLLSFQAFVRRGGPHSYSLAPSPPGLQGKWGMHCWSIRKDWRHLYCFMKVTCLLIFFFRHTVVWWKLPLRARKKFTVQVTTVEPQLRNCFAGEGCHKFHPDVTEMKAPRLSLPCYVCRIIDYQLPQCRMTLEWIRIPPPPPHSVE